jgi:hypothetical protein
LRGNSRLKTFKPRISTTNQDAGYRQVLAIAGALKENKGLVDLNLNCAFMMSNKIWDVVYDSVKTHPTLQVLHLLDGEATLASAMLKVRLQTLVDMLKVSLLIHTIHLPDHYREHELYRESIVPYLVTNRHRSHVRAIQKPRPFAYRAKVLGKALFTARADANTFWMLLSGNAEVAFSSTIVTITLAANLLEPSTAAATSNTAAVAVTTAVAVTAIAVTATASTSGASAVDNDIYTTSCQKRKTRP